MAQVALFARVSSCIIPANLASQQWLSEDTPTLKGNCPVCAARTVANVCRDRTDADTVWRWGYLRERVANLVDMARHCVSSLHYIRPEIVQR